MQQINITRFKTEKGVILNNITLSYETTGPALHSAPIVVVCHALTGNSSVAGPNGWWARLIGPGQTIDTNHITILTFNIPGNGYDGHALPNPQIFTLRDVAQLFLLGLQQLHIATIDLLIGASLGGALIWQIAMLSPQLSKKIVPIACDYDATDWLLAQTHLQSLLLTHSTHPLHDARVHGMLCYRTPHSLNTRFHSERNPQTECPHIIEWLDYHGRTLSERFLLSAYQTMTYLTSTIHAASSAKELQKIKGNIHIISIDTDLLFSHYRAIETTNILQQYGHPTVLHTIHSIHGHDAFLMEYEQLNNIMHDILSTNS